MKLFWLALLLAVAALGQPKPQWRFRTAATAPVRSLRPEARHWIVPADARKEIEISGGQILADLRDGRLLATGAEGISGAETIDSQTKVSAALAGDGYYLVTFYQDVPAVSARVILDRIGLGTLPNPDLLEHQFLVKGTETQAHTAAEWDEVAHVYPASADLVSGEPVYGCPGPLTDFGSIGQYIAIVGHGWAGSEKGSVELTYSFSRLSSSVPASVIRTAVEQALAEWSRAANVKFSYSQASGERRNLNLLFASGDHGDPYPFSAGSRILAHTFYPADINPEPIAGDLHFNDDQLWQNGGQYDFYSVVLHEIGHALGLGHSDRPTSVMYPYYRKLDSLQAEDIEAIQQIYAPPSGPPTIPPVSSDAPSLRFQAPTSVTGASVDLTGTVEGGTGDVQVTWSNAGGSGSAEGGRTWTARGIPLAIGVNSVELRVIDSLGAGSSRIATVVRTQPAPVPANPAASGPAPGLTITSPAMAITATSAATIRISGTAHDNAGVAAVTWTSSAGRSGTATGTTSWSFELPLYVGDNPVVIRVRNTAGIERWRSLNVVRK